MTIRIKRKGGKKSNTHAKKSLFSREKSKIATKALKVARLVICIIRCRCCLAPPAVCLRNMQGGRGGAIYFFCDLSFFKKKNQTQPITSRTLHSFNGEVAPGGGFGASSGVFWGKGYMYRTHESAPLAFCALEFGSLGRGGSGR